MSKTIVEDTVVTKKESTLSDILGAPTGESTITQTGPNNLFDNNSKPKTTFTELEKSKDEAVKKAKEEADKIKAEKDAEKAPAASTTPAAKTTSIIADIVAETEEEVEQKKAAGRPAISRDALLSGIEQRIKDKVFLELDGEEKPLAEYSTSELWEVVDLNLSHKDEIAAEQAQAGLYDALPEEFQQAITYFAQGGTDIQHILKVLTQKVELNNLDPRTEDGQEKIIRNYLSYTRYGTPEEIEEEVNSIKDRGDLEKKSNQFKPKLDAAQEEVVNRNLKAAEVERKKAEKASANYMDNVIKALEPGLIAGIKIDRKEKADFYNSLVNPTHQSFTGRTVNEFGYLIEQKQFGPQQDLEAIFLARWALKDKEGLIKRLREQGGSDMAAAVAKKLKTEESSKNSATGTEVNDDARRGVKKLQRKEANNIFK